MQSVFDIFSGSMTRLKGKWGKLMLLNLVIVLLYVLCFIPVFFFIDFDKMLLSAQNNTVQTEYWYLTLYEYLLAIFLLLPVSWAFMVMFLKNIRGEEESFKVARLFDGFKDYVRITFTQLLVNVCTILWSILLIVPGIMKYYSYAMTPYVLYDNPKVGYGSAMDISSKMMYGYRFKLFGLQCLFVLVCLGFSILNAFVTPLFALSVFAGFGVVILLMIVYAIFVAGFIVWFSSLYYSSCANFYDQLKKEYETSFVIVETTKE